MSDAAAEIETEDEVNLPTKEVIQKHLKNYLMMDSDKAEAQGQIGALVKKAENEDNIHRKAFKLLAQLERMDDSKRSEFLVHLFHYIGVLDLGPHPDLFEDDLAKEVAKMARTNDDAILDSLEKPELTVVE